jgi:hypothetical protein
MPEEMIYFALTKKEYSIVREVLDYFLAKSRKEIAAIEDSMLSVEAVKRQMEQEAYAETKPE